MSLSRILQGSRLQTVHILTEINATAESLVKFLSRSKMTMKGCSGFLFALTGITMQLRNKDLLQTKPFVISNWQIRQ